MANDFSIVAKLKLDTKSIQNQLNSLQNRTIHIGADTKDFEMSISVANAVMNKFLDVAGAMVDQVYELDKAITEFKKVSDLRGTGLNEYIEELGEAGRLTARTMSEMTEAATMFRKSGFTDQDAAELATVATMYQNIADTEVAAADAAASIVSQIQAFGRGTIEPIHIIDAYNKVANNFAVGTNDLSRALELSAAGMATYGNSFEEVIGIVTAGTEMRNIVS